MGAEMTEPKDGGPAFPMASVPPQQGMTLRDWFAGQALAGLLANPNRPGYIADAINDSWRYAGAMLAARGVRLKDEPKSDG